MSTYADYSDLKADVESWAARSDFPATVYGLATTRINRLLRVREMLSDFSATTSAETVTLPTDLLEFQWLYLDKDPRLVLHATDSWASTAGYRASGTPASYFVLNDVLHLNPVPDGSYDLVGKYYAALADFSLDADTNEVLTDYPEVYLAACLATVFKWTRDEAEEAKWNAIFLAAVNDANAHDVRARFSGPIMMRPRASA